MSIILREVEKTDEKQILEIYKEYMESELIPGIERFEGIRDFEKFEKMNFEEWFQDLEKNKDEKNLPNDYSPHILYLALDGEKIVGTIGIRWKKVPVLMSHGGLVGYSVRPSERGKGYAIEMLKLGLEKFDGTNIDKVLITCKDFNLASKRVIEKNGGIFEKTCDYDGYTFLRYWINISK